MRLHVKPVKRISTVGLPYYHGLTTNYYESGEQTKKGEPELTLLLNNANLINFEYLTEKWGPGWRNTCPTEFPFNNESNSVSFTTYNLEFVRKKYLGF